MCEGTRPGESSSTVGGGGTSSGAGRLFASIRDSIAAIVQSTDTRERPEGTGATLPLLQDRNAASNQRQSRPSAGGGGPGKSGHRVVPGLALTMCPRATAARASM